jgi:hypothetical protein
MQGAHVAHRGLAAVQGRQRDRHARELQARHRGARAVHGIDDQHSAGFTLGLHQAAILGVEGQAGRATGDELLELALGELVDGKRHVAARARARRGAGGEAAQLPDDAIAQAASEL